MGNMAKRAVPAPFLTKTYELVDDAETNDVVSWNNDGTAFVVWKTAEFARDLLPKYFKHNNFSSFVRQLNTYGFHKVVPDKWEFANENFRLAQGELLSAIHRRKTASAKPENPGGEGSATQSTSAGEDLGSSSSSAAESAAARAQLAEISGENEKLKRDNEVLSSELAQMKRQCDELVVFLTKYVKVGPDQIERIMRDGKQMDGCDGSEEEGEEEEAGLKLFGVWMKKKRKIINGGDDKQINGVDFLSSSMVSGKVCN